MKQATCCTAIATLLVSTSVFAGTFTARPITGFELMSAGLGPIDIITPENAAPREDRHL